MKTADLVRLLAEDTQPTRSSRLAPRVLAAGLAGAVVSAIILVFWLGLRPLGAASVNPSYWMKTVYTLVVSAAGLAMAASLARPGGRIGAAGALPFAAVAWLMVLAVLEAERTPASQLAGLWLSYTWNLCPFRILALATPVYAAVLLAMRNMAPTQPALAAAAAGLFAGAVGATVYGLYCQESAAAFVVVWYTVGIAASAALGALIGGRLLRW